MEKGTVHALIFPCRKKGNDWVDASTQKWIDIDPTHFPVIKPGTFQACNHQTGTYKLK